MSGHNDELIEELRNIRIRLAREIIELQTRHEAYIEQKREVAELRHAIEEVLEEIETGRSGRPLLDAAASNGAAQRLAAATGPAETITPADLARARARPSAGRSSGPPRPPVPRSRTAAKKARKS